MPVTLLTDKAIRALKPTMGKQVDFFDMQERALAIRVSSGGTKTFYHFYWIGGKQVRRALGRYGDITLAEARETVRQDRKLIAKQIDPADKSRQEKDSYKTDLFPSRVDEYVTKELKDQTRSARERERILRREFCGVWLRRTIGSITRADVTNITDQIVARRKPGAANNAFRTISAFFGWCVERGIITNSPTFKMKPPGGKLERHRVLGITEITKIWQATITMGYPFGSIMQLLMLTGLRLREVSAMEWREIDFARSEWTINERRMKNGLPHVIPLSSQAQVILASVPRLHEIYVFPARDRNNPVSGFSKWKEALNRLSSVEGWRNHDVRRTVFTEMGRLGIPREIRHKIVNHAEKRLDGIYDRYEYYTQKKDALERWGTHLDTLIEQAKIEESNEHLAKESHDQGPS